MIFKDALRNMKAYGALTSFLFSEGAVEELFEVSAGGSVCA